MTLRAVVAMMEHETNTFSPVPTPLARFGSPEVPTGDEVYERFRGTGTGLGAFLGIATEEDMEIVTPIAAHAAPSGPVQVAAYQTICDAICDAVAKGCDVCFLDLHGAMVAETTVDGEGTLLKRIREMAPELPIAVSLDLHANLTEDIVNNCTALVGYKTYPHIDMYEAGEHAGRIVVRALKGEVRPVMAWGNRPILAQTLRMGHEDRPMGPLIEVARAEEASGLLAASVFGGFPLADFWHAGLSVVTVADGDRARAESACEKLLDAAWDEREEFVFQSEPLEQTIAGVKPLTDGPIILLDHADNSASGRYSGYGGGVAGSDRAGSRGRGHVRHLRPGSGRRDGGGRSGQHPIVEARWQGRYADYRSQGRAAGDQGKGPCAYRRRVRHHRAHGSRDHHCDGQDGGARYRESADRGHLAAHRALRSRLLPKRGHRAHPETFFDPEVAYPLSSRVQSHCRPRAPL